MEQQKRWYDIDPTVSLAVNLIKNATDDVQLKCADYIITRNTADYSDSIVPVLTPEEFITKHS